MKVLEKHVELPRVSPDGKWILGWYREIENDMNSYKYDVFLSAERTANRRSKLSVFPRPITQLGRQMDEQSLTFLMTITR